MPDTEQVLKKISKINSDKSQTSCQYSNRQISKILRHFRDFFKSSKFGIVKNAVRVMSKKIECPVVYDSCIAIQVKPINLYMF